MESPRLEKNSLTESQQKAVKARGNVLVMAGAGTGKTKTLVERCLDCLARDRAQLDELLIVTFTEAAAAELRQRLRRAMEEKLAAESLTPQLSTINFWNEQHARFDLAHIGTLHSFCLQLIREHFYELGLDPQFAILDEGEARQRANETLDEQFQSHYEGESEFSRAVQTLIQIHGGGRDEKIRALILRLYHHAQTRPDAAGWLAAQIKKFSTAEPAGWQSLLLATISDWRDEWLPVLENLKSGNEKAAELAGQLQQLKQNPSRQTAAEILAQMAAADLTASYPKGRAGKLRPALGKIFEEADFLRSLATLKDGADPLAEDWSWVHDHMETLLRLAQEFTARFSDRKRSDGVVDFHDLEQFALRLLWDFSADKPTGVAAAWREKLRFVFVDEYQDINAAQDKIVAALARDSSPSPRPSGERAGVRGPEIPNNLPPHPDLLLLSEGEGEEKITFGGNRFLVGDVKQSIYRFRLADPAIFRGYAHSWHGANGETIPLAENFRSREGLLDFVNSVCRCVMRAEIGGVDYDANAELRFGAPETRTGLSTAKDPGPCAELLVRFKQGRDETSGEEDGEPADLGEAEREARLVARRLRALKDSGHKILDEQTADTRAVEWSDMAILLRSPRGKSEIFAKEFERAGIPLAVARGGFFESAEILDLLSLLQLLDNPLQDVPCIAVLRSPLVGLSLYDLAEIRLAAKDKHFWTALNSTKNSKFKVQNFLERFARWRKTAKQVSLSQCLEEILAETLYADWLRAQPRGAQRAANIARFLQLAQQFDQFQRQGLFRFLKFIEAQQEAEVEPEVSAAATENAVRLMSIHQSKGLEFPVVVLADLAKNFNEQDLHGEIIFDEELGLCPKVKPPASGRRYPSLPHWLAQRRQKRELRGEELRLLYVALTRARDHLILTASIAEKNWDEKWSRSQPVTIQKIAEARSFADWLALWFQVEVSQLPIQGACAGEFKNLRWQVVADTELAVPPGEISGEPAPVDDGDGTPERSSHRPLDDVATEKLRATLAWTYPFAAATTRKAKASVTTLRREAEELADEAERVFPATPKSGKRKAESGKPKLGAAETGLAHHKFLQQVALEKTSELTAEADRLVRENYLSDAERAALDLESLADFWNSELGDNIRADAALVRRELPFTARFSPAELEAITGRKAEPGLEEEFVVVQGVADLVLLRPAGIWLVDFKTDAVGKSGLPEKIRAYTPQLQLYAAALEKIFARKVTRRALHFLGPRQTVEI